MISYYLKRILLVCGWLLIATKLYAAENNNTSLAASLPNKQQLPELTLNSILTGEFTQAKKIKVLSRAIRSSGTVTISPEYGVLWQTLKPVKSVLRITPDEVAQIQQQAGNKQLKSITGSNNFAQYLLAIYQADWQQLSSAFSIDYKELTPEQDGNLAAIAETENVNKWQLTLTPKQESLALVFETIVVQGANTIEQITLLEPSKNVTTIQLDLTVSAQLTVEEQEYFAL